MLRLRSSILAHLLSSLPTYPGCSVQRFLSAAAPRSSPHTSFAVEDYLVGSCGLTRAQALKASTKISHIKSSTNPDAVLAFLAGLGLSTTDVAAVVAKDPKFLCTGVGRTLAPIVLELAGLGLSNAEIACLVSLAPGSFRCKPIVSNLPYYLSLFGSFDNLCRVLKRCPDNLLLSDLDTVVKPKVAFLRECGLSACGIAKLCVAQPRLLSSKPEHLQAMVACAEGLGVPRGSGMFRQPLHGVAFLSEEKIAVQVENLKNMFRWSDAEVRIAVSKYPMMLRRSNDILRTRSEFLISEVGLEPDYIAHRPAILSYSLVGRLRPRYYVLKFLKENGLLDHNRDYYTAVTNVEETFMEKFMCPHNEAAPYLAQDYEAASRGEVPTRFRFV